MSDITIGFVGAGRMAQAIGQGIAGQAQITPQPAQFCDPDDSAGEQFARMHPGAVRQASVSGLCENCHVLVLAVKPRIMPNVLQQLGRVVDERQLVVSVAAGITLATLNQALKTSRIFRVMPNTPCLIGQGISAIACHETVPESDRAMVGGIFGAIGQTVEVPEYQMDAVTGLSGSGPAYVYTFVESLVDGGVLAGLPRAVARQLAMQTVQGSLALLQASDKSPADLRGEVTSPGGTTMAAMAVLERAGFRGIVMDAVVSAARRARELADS